MAPTLVLGAEVALDVGPAPDQGDTKAVHATLGAGRRVWVDIQDTWQLKFKQVSMARPLQVCIEPASQPAASDQPCNPPLLLCCSTAGAATAGPGLQHLEA